MLQFFRKGGGAPLIQKSLIAPSYLIYLTPKMSESKIQNSKQPRKAGKQIGKKTRKREKKNRIQCRKDGAGMRGEGPRGPVPTRLDPTDFSMYESSTHYILDHMNSITFVNPRIYNLLKVRPRNLWGRIVKCKCSKSKCIARYCECFHNGQICGIDCSCTNCENNNEGQLESMRNENLRQEIGCKCSKSECMKNYCECFQKGQNCNDRCKCSNCRNTA